MSLSHRPLHQNQIFKIPITFYNARRQQSSRTVEFVDHTYEKGHYALIGGIQAILPRVSTLTDQFKHTQTNNSGKAAKLLELYQPNNLINV